MLHNVMYEKYPIRIWYGISHLAIIADVITVGVPEPPVVSDTPDAIEVLLYYFY